jgi:hypothetical protein
MKKKNTNTKATTSKRVHALTPRKKKSLNRRKKILNNDEEYHFQDDIDIDDDFDSRDDTDVELEISDDDIDLVEAAEKELNVLEDILEVDAIIEKVIVSEEPKKKRGRKTADKEKFYVEPKKFDEEIMKYYESGKMSDELANMVSKISHKLSYAPNFINYSYREEMVGDGIIRMMKALISQKYNREKGTNPFSYFTRIAFNAFRNRIKKEKHIHETHEKYQKEVMFMSEQFNNLSKNNNIRIMKEKNREY